MNERDKRKIFGFLGGGKWQKNMKERGKMTQN